MDIKGAALEDVTLTLHCDRMLDLDLWVGDVVPNARSAKTTSKWCEHLDAKCDFGEHTARRGDIQIQSGADKETVVAGTHNQNGRK